MSLRPEVSRVIPLLGHMKTAAAVGWLASVLSTACAGQPDREGIELIEVWEASAGFASPESVVFDPRRERFYVSNVNGYEKNGAGFVSRLGTDRSVRADRKSVV